MFRRIASVLFAGMLIVAGVGWGQNTTSTPTVFDIVSPQPGDTRPRVKVDPPYLMSDNRVGTIFSNDTSWSYIASADSIDSYANGKDLYWSIKVEGKSTADSLVYLKLEEFDFYSNRLLITRRDTLDFSTGLGLPGGAAYADSNTFSMPLGLTITTQTWATYTAGISNWASYIYFLHTKINPASFAGANAVYELPALLDSLTVISSDSGNDGRRILGTPVTGRYGYMTLFLDGRGKTGTAAAFKVIAQVKDIGGEWSGDIDLYGDTVFVLKDSVAVDSSKQKAFQPTIPPADSVKFGVEYLVAAGKNYLDKLKALWRD